MTRVNATLTRVIDGDTAKFTINLEKELEMLLPKTIRFAWIDTPEIKGVEKEEGLMVSAYVEDRLLRANSIELELFYNDNFGRLIAGVFVDGVNLCEELLLMGYAVPYGQ